MLVKNWYSEMGIVINSVDKAEHNFIKILHVAGWVSRQCIFSPSVCKNDRVASSSYFGLVRTLPPITDVINMVTASKQSKHFLAITILSNQNSVRRTCHIDL